MQIKNKTKEQIIKELSENHPEFTYEKLRANIKKALYKGIRESKAVLEPYQWSYGFRIMDNGSVIAQWYCGSLWVYSTEPHYVFGNKTWHQKIAEKSDLAIYLKTFYKSKESKETHVDEILYEFLRCYEANECLKTA